jgi:hypothetical protein
MMLALHVSRRLFGPKLNLKPSITLFVFAIPILERDFKHHLSAPLCGHQLLKVEKPHFLANQPINSSPAGSAQAQHQFLSHFLTSTTPALLQTHSRTFVTSTPFQTN